MMGRKAAIIAGAILGAAYYVLGYMFTINSMDVMAWEVKERAGLVIFAPCFALLGAMIAMLIHDN